MDYHFESNFKILASKKNYTKKQWRTNRHAIACVYTSPTKSSYKTAIFKDNWDLSMLCAEEDKFGKSRNLYRLFFSMSLKYL